MASCRLGPLAAVVLVSAGLVSGCEATIDGRPFVNPALATLPNFRPAPPMPTPRPPVPQSGFPQELDPDEKGFLYVVTEYNDTRCRLTRVDVQCESQFTQAPIIGPQRANSVYVSADGAVRWMVSNLAVNPAVKIDARVYFGLGWTIAAKGDGTRITNDSTGHGMFVSVHRVETF